MSMECEWFELCCWQRVWWGNDDDPEVDTGRDCVDGDCTRDDDDPGAAAVAVVGVMIVVGVAVIPRVGVTAFTEVN